MYFIRDQTLTLVMCYTSKVDGTIHMHERVACFLNECAPGLRQPGRALPISDKELESMFLFNFHDQLAKPRLANLQPLRSSRKIQFLCQNHSSIQMANLYLYWHCIPRVSTSGRQRLGTRT